MGVKIMIGDCRSVLAELPAESVQCVVTSPPYWGLRDYGVEGQLGLEATPEEYVATMVDVFEGVRRVLKPDGVLWLNLGDSYTTGGSTSARSSDPKAVGEVSLGLRRIGTPAGLKSKDLVGIPWRVAFALQAAGWWLRQDIIWSKPNPMPESVTDRCTKAHEYIFMLTKSARYYFDAEAIAEDLAPASVSRLAQDVGAQMGSSRVPGKTNGPMKAVRRSRGVPPRHGQYPSSDQSGLDGVGRGEGRNKRSVWTIATQPFKEAHFATFPPALVEPCILAGSAEGDTVLDPFGGAGTVGLVADRWKRSAILIELNPAYAAIADARIRDDAPLFVEAT